MSERSGKGRSITQASLRQKRERLEKRIALERLQFTRASQQWHEATMGFDQRIVRLSTWRKPVMVVGSLLLARQLRRSPGRLITLGKRAVALYALARNARSILHRIRSH